MGTRSHNILLFAPGILISALQLKPMGASAVQYDINSGTYSPKLDAEDFDYDRSNPTMYLFETNFKPMKARLKDDPNFDLKMEVQLQDFLSNQNDHEFLLLRHGDNGFEERGDYVSHPFNSHPDFIEFQAYMLKSFV